MKQHENTRHPKAIVALWLINSELLRATGNPVIL
jgi:hypothetical protein